MSLTDLMSNAGLSGYAEAGLILFFLAFLGIIWWVFRPANRKRWNEDAKLPLEDYKTQTPRMREDSDNGH